MSSVSSQDTGYNPVTAAPAILPYAGFLIRFVAYLIDSILVSIVGGIIMAPAMVIYFAALLLSTDDSPNVALLLVAVLVMFITVLVEIIVVAVYFAWFESSRFMATPGKMLLKLKVTDANGNRISFLMALLRFILKSVLNQFFWIGSLFILLNDKKQGIYDLLLNTYVIQSE